MKKLQDLLSQNFFIVSKKAIKDLKNFLDVLLDFFDLESDEENFYFIKKQKFVYNKYLDLF